MHENRRIRFWRKPCKSKKMKWPPGTGSIGPPGRPQSRGDSVHFFGFALEERPDAVPFDDIHHGVQGLPVGVERVIPYGRGIIFAYNSRYPTCYT